MVKKLLIKLAVSFFSFSSLSPLLCSNVKHDPSEFLKLSSGEWVTHPIMTTKANQLHGNNITGKGIKIAVLDTIFHPEDIGILNEQGCISPVAIQKKLVLTPDEHLEQLDLEQLKLNLLSANALPEDKELVSRKEYFDSFDSFKKNGLGHGTLVMRILHSMAPDAQLFPVDIGCKGIRDVDAAKSFASAVGEVIDDNVDIISLSSHVLSSSNQDYINALKEAVHKGIAIICAGGNGSTKQKAIYLDTVQNKPNLMWYNRDEKKAFDEVNGKGMLFCGSMGYKKTGEEFLSEFSQHPAHDTLKHYILAPGENIIAPLMVPGVEHLQHDIIPRDGTSISAPVTAGALALLIQYAKDKGLAHTTGDLLRILYNSGHNLTHNIRGTRFKTYKALNLHNAMQQVDNLVNPPSTPANNLKITKSTRTKKKRSSLAKGIKSKSSVTRKAKASKKRRPKEEGKKSVRKSRSIRKTKAPTRTHKIRTTLVRKSKTSAQRTKKSSR